MSPSTSSSRFLPRVLALDAASCAATGAVQLALTDALSRRTGLPTTLLVSTGAILLVCAVMAALVGRRQPTPRTLVGIIALGNAAWAAACALAAAVLWSGLTPLGIGWLLAQAVTVLVLAECQWMGLRAGRRDAGGAMAM